MQSVHINMVSVLSRLNLEKMQGLFSPRDKKKVHNNEVSFKQMSMKWDLTVLIFRRSRKSIDSPTCQRHTHSPKKNKHGPQCINNKHCKTKHRGRNQKGVPTLDASDSWFTTLCDSKQNEGWHQGDCTNHQILWIHNPVKWSKDQCGEGQQEQMYMID